MHIFYKFIILYYCIWQKSRVKMKKNRQSPGRGMQKRNKRMVCVTKEEAAVTVEARDTGNARGETVKNIPDKGESTCM